jgi:diketogulonate reductase-like aldo/keto reductase
MPFPRASRIGFGCASLGSRIGADAGVAAVRAAFDKGVNWFDLAPSYGDGRAEEIFSRFSRGRRSEIHICTKCGIARPRVNAVAVALKPLARRILSYGPGLRQAIARGRTAAVRIPLSAELIRFNIEQSLRRLGTDYVDVLALHDPDPSEFERDDVCSALQGAVDSGYARTIGVAGSLEAATAALRLGLPISLIQVADNPLRPQAARLASVIPAASKRVFVTTHSLFGDDVVRITERALRAYPELKELLRTAGYSISIKDALRAALVDYALKTNSSGTVLLSMFRRPNLDFNVERMSLIQRPDATAFFGALRVRLHGGETPD